MITWLIPWAALAFAASLALSGCGGTTGQALEDQFDAVMGGDLTALAPGAGSAAGANVGLAAGPTASPEELQGELDRLRVFIETAVRETHANYAAKGINRDEERRLRRWAVEFADAARSALKNPDPFAGLLDVWALARRMREFLSTAEAGAFMGAGLQPARQATDKIEREVEKLVAKYLPPETARVAELRLTEYVHSRPLRRPRSLLGRWLDPFGIGRDLFSAVSGILSLPLAPGQAIRSLGRGANEMRKFNVTAARFTNVIQGLPRQTRLELETLLASSDNFTTISQALRDVRESAVAINEAMATADSLTSGVRDIILTAGDTAGTVTDTARAAGDTADRFTIAANAVKEAAAALAEAAESISRSGFRPGAVPTGPAGQIGPAGAAAGSGGMEGLRETAESITRAAESVKAAAEASRELTRTMREGRGARGGARARRAGEPEEVPLPPLPFDATQPSPPADQPDHARPGDLVPRGATPNRYRTPPPPVDLSEIENGGFDPRDYTEAARAIEQGAFAVREMLADIRAIQDRNEEMRQKKRAEGLDARGFQPLEYKAAADAISGAAANIHGTLAKVEELVDTGKLSSGAEGVQQTIEPFFVMAVGRAQAITDYIVIRVAILLVITFTLGMIFVIVQRRIPADGQFGRRPPPPAIEQ